MPNLWNETMEAHRHAVRDAILDTTWALVTEHGLTSVTMSQIAEKTGIGRATLYKYFPDVEAILFAWHQRHVTGHLAHLAELRDQAGDAGERLEAVLEAYALISYHREHHGTELAALLHRGEQVARAQQQLIDMIRDLLTEVAETGDLRDDVAPDELASYCLHALTAASSLPSKAAVRRLVTVTLAGLRPPRWLVPMPLEPDALLTASLREYQPVLRGRGSDVPGEFQEMYHTGASRRRLVEGADRDPATLATPEL